MSLSLIEMSKIALGKDDILKAMVLEIYARYSDLLYFLPFDEYKGEKLYGAGGDIDVSKFDITFKGFDKRAKQEVKGITEFALKVERYLLEELFDKSGIIIGKPKDTERGKYIDVDKVIGLVRQPTHLLLSEDQGIHIWADEVRDRITYGQDTFGRRIMEYNRLPVIVVRCGIENLVGCVRLSDDGVCGLQNFELEVRDLGELQEKPSYRTRIEWYADIDVRGEKAIACGGFWNEQINYFDFVKPYESERKKWKMGSWNITPGGIKEETKGEVTSIKKEGE